MRIWDEFLTPMDVKVYEAAGFGEKGDLGTRPAILVIDVIYNTVGDKREPILKSIERYRLSCGEKGWEAIDCIRELLEAARAQAVPIIYSTNATRPDGVDLGRWAAKNRRAREDATKQDAAFGYQIVKEVAPEPRDTVIHKLKPSMFFGTPLVSILRNLDVDTLLITGVTTSGCVRATTIDAFSYEFKIAVVEECCYDRGEANHAINLFDINSKYGNVIPLEEAKAYLADLPARRAAPAEMARA